MKAPVQFGPYQLLERISVGGMAEVYKAKEEGVEGFERFVAVKRILPHVAEDEEFIAMFKDEAKIAVQLAHGNIAQIYNLGNYEDSFYIALEYVAGRDLRAIFQRCQQAGDPMPVEQACYIMMKVCEGLDYAHNKKDRYGRELNIVHRDVSPPNILVSYEGEVKLIDFGVAKAAGRASKTQAGILKGKFGYMSPEQVRGMPLDRRSDVFSVGVVLWEVLTGRRLFQGDTDFATLEMVRAVEVPPPSSINPKIPKALERISFKALAREPEQRYQSAIELHDELQAFMFAEGLFYSRKALAGWMRTQYAKEIELEKQKANEQRDAAKKQQLRQRKTMMMGPGGGPPPPPGARPPAPPGRKAPPPAPPKPGGGPPPRSGGARPARPSAVPTQSHRAVPPAGAPPGPPRPKGVAKKTMMMSTARPAGLPPPAGGAAPSPRPRPKPAAPAAGARGGSDFDWDDDELETRLFDGDGAQELSEANRASQMQAARRVEVGGGAPSARPSPKPAGPPRSAAAAPAPAAAPTASEAPTAVIAAPPMSPGQPAPRADEGAGSSKKGLILGVAALLGIVIIGGVGYAFMNKDGGGSGGPATASAATGSLTVTVSPEDAQVLVDNKPVVGSSPFVVSDLPEGTHKVLARREGFLPFEKDIQVKAGSPISLPVELALESVNLKLDVQPADAQVSLVVGNQVTAIGKAGQVYTLRRQPGVTYQVEVSAPGHATQRVPLVLGNEPTQSVAVALAPSGAGAGGQAAAPTPAATPQPAPAKRTSRPKTKRTTKTTRPKPAPKTKPKAKTATLAIANAPGTPPAAVSVDGRGIGKTPRPNHKVTPGKHTVKCSWPGSAPDVQRVSVADGQRLLVRCKKK